MAVYVTQDYYSGIENPRWKLTPKQVKELKRRFAELPVASLPRLENRRLILGYTGVHVESTDGELPEFQVWKDRVQLDRSRAMRLDAGRQLEQWLIDGTMPEDVKRTFGQSFAFASRELNEQVIDGLPPLERIGGLRCTTAPAFPGNVMPWTSRKRGNNCYAYANNDPAPDETVPMPGRRDTNINHTVNELREGALQDRLEPLSGSRFDTCPVGPDAHYMVICLREQTGQARDFHCLRLDADGTWSHKDGRHRVRKTDDTGANIVDLRTARFSAQMDFVGIFASVKGVRRIFQA